MPATRRHVIAAAGLAALLLLVAVSSLAWHVYQIIIHPVARAQIRPNDSGPPAAPD